MREPVRDYIPRMIEMLLEVLMLQQYKIHVHYMDADDSQDSRTLAKISTNFEYFFSNMDIYPELVKDYEDGHCVFDYILHEMCHHFGNGIVWHAKSTAAPAAIEFLKVMHEQDTVRLTTVLSRLIPAADKAPKEIEIAESKTESPEHGQENEKATTEATGQALFCNNRGRPLGESDCDCIYCYQACLEKEKTSRT